MAHSNKTLQIVVHLLLVEHIRQFSPFGTTNTRASIFYMSRAIQDHDDTLLFFPGNSFEPTGLTNNAICGDYVTYGITSSPTHSM